MTHTNLLLQKWQEWPEYVVVSHEGTREAGKIYAPETTCENGYGPCNPIRAFLCSECRYDASTYGDSDCDPSQFEFCPMCGARVEVER